MCRTTPESGASTPTLFEDVLRRATGILWPRHEDTGKLDLRGKTFDTMAKAYPQTESLRQLRHTRNKMRKVKLAIGADGRNRTVLWPFAGKTGRSQPKASEWIFSPGGVVAISDQAGPGRALAYIDWSGMEFLIAASLSNCQPMLDLYATGIPYIGFAQRFDARPAGRHQEIPPAYSRALQGRLPGRAVQHAARHAGAAAGHFDVRGTRDAEPASRAVLEILGVGGRLDRDTRSTPATMHTAMGWTCSPASPNSTPARSAIGPCRQPVPIFCGSPASRAIAAA